MSHDYYLGRISAWLESLVDAGAVDELKGAKASLTALIEKAKTCSDEDFDFVFGQAISRLEQFASVEALSDKAKEKVEKLLGEVGVFVKGKGLK